ncbi:MAG: flagellar hook-length control protein FliK [Epsilonproteobacteria bacterium]|nr:flagellar hook-length control protein FliK [Campylobacterota bacterium]
MQEIFAFVQTQSSPLSLGASTHNSTILSTNESGGDTFANSFFSIILGQLTHEGTVDVTEQTNTLLPINTPQTVSFSEEAKSIDEHLLDELLSVIQMLQEDFTQTSFPTLNASPTLDKLLASEATRQEFAAVKSVSELVNLSEKYNLGLEKISITQESLESLQTKFPTLKESGFFEDLQTAFTNVQNNQTKELPKPLTNNVMSFLDKQQTSKSETTPTPSILSELIAKETPSKSDVTSTQQTQMVNEKQQQTTPTPLESIVQKALNANETKKTEPFSQTTKKAVTEVVPKTETNIIDEPLSLTTKAEESHTPTKVNETKPLENILKTVKLETHTDDVAMEEEVLKTQKTTLTIDETTTNTSDETQPILSDKSDIKTAFKQEVNTKSAGLKESLNQFASDLQEKIETYKPPIMKVELALSPKNLGEVDVTLLTRGNNLHVNISSNATTMSLFTQNQAEVKSALINMGFTNLEMNFSDQRSSEQSQQNQKQNNSSGNFDSYTTENSEEETTLLEIVIPQYV